MSNKYQNQIIHALLDKYERSSYYIDKKEYTGKIILRFYDGGKCDFLPYDIEQADKRISINQAVISMAEKGLLEYKWMKGEQNHIIAKVWIYTDNLSQLYTVANREPKGDAIDKVLNEITELERKMNAKWVLGYLHDIYDAISKKRSMINTFPSNRIERNLLFSAISAIDALGDSEIPERVFSLHTFGDSKVFERDIKSRLLGILRKYSENDDDVSDEDLLKQIGIVRHPEQFEFCGHIILSYTAGAIDFSLLKNGSAIFSSDLESGTITISPDVKKIITIENRTNYLEYIKNIDLASELVIYHGGQYSLRKCKFFRLIAASLPDECQWYHWSDIDYGGFLMLLRLRREISPVVTPYKMSIDELEKYRNHTASIKPSYIKKLESLKNYSEITDCFECIDYMISNKLRLEQEAMLIDDLVK